MKMTIGTNIKRLRAAKEITQEQLSVAMNVTCAAVSKWERSEASPDTDNLILLARLYNVSLDELGRQIFSASVGSKTAQELLRSDYKEFHIAGHDLAVSQITCMDSPVMLERKEEFLAIMRQRMKVEGLDMIILMLTDVLLEGTQLIYVGDDDTIQQAFNVIPKEQTVFLPRVMSRKKQVIPMLSALWG